MNIGIGCDIVEHAITSKLGWNNKPKVLSRFFSSAEIKQISGSKTIRFISGRFAAKEAVLKAIGIAMEDGISLKDIQIFQETTGKPYVQLQGTVQEKAYELGIDKIELSISHSQHYSIATAITIKEKLDTF